MPIYGKRKELKQFPQASDGLHPFLCVDVAELGPVSTPWGVKEKLQLVYFIGDETDDEGGPLYCNHFVTNSLFETSNLYEIVTALTGSPPPPDGNFDLEKALIGKQGRVMTERKVKTNGLYYANPTRVYKRDPRDELLAKPVDYVRIRDRKKQKPNGQGRAAKPAAAAAVAGASTFSTVEEEQLHINDKDVPY